MAGTYFKVTDMGVLNKFGAIFRIIVIDESPLQSIG
jgi:hypothetical protein